MNAFTRLINFFKNQMFYNVSAQTKRRTQGIYATLEKSNDLFKNILGNKNNRFKSGLVGKLIFSIFVFYIPVAKAQEIPTLLKADRVDYDVETDVVTAIGNVELTKGQMVLRADVVTYNKKTEQMHARGNVWFKNEIGEIYFFHVLDFTKEMKNGFGKEIKGILIDNARLAAKTGQKIGDRRMIFQKGVYSPCNVCKQKPDLAPLWQLKADKIIHDKENQTVIYHHARMECFGLPFFYSPYFRHADSSV